MSEMNKNCNNNMAMLTNNNRYSIPYTFEGKDDENVTLFIEDFKSYVELLEYTEKEKVVALKLALRGRANTWLRSIQSNNFEDIISKMQSRFLSRHPVLAALSKIEYLSILGGESY